MALDNEDKQITICLAAGWSGRCGGKL